MTIKILLTVEVERTQGKFESKEGLAEKIIEELSDPGTITGDNEGEYEVTSWEAEYVEDEKPKGKRR